ncbi:capsule assembly Wzi family protein [Chromatiaceae bacterium AAb-1]|nr:capsule assembly Wzi family protein [Chromatiaceae bacterium AAb-1]
MKLSFSLTASAIVAAFAMPAVAAPWLDTSDNYLRQSLQTLAHAGIITGPVNTYPLMWKNIVTDLAATDEPDSDELRFALAHVRSALNANQHNYIAGVKLKASSDPSLYQSFGESYFERAGISVFKEYLGSNWAAKTQVNYRNFDGDNPEQEMTYDGSYLAAVFGNWVIAADQIPLWWGPGQQTALLLSNNARPLPSVRLTRHGWQAPQSSWLSWLGPWTFSTFLGQGEHATTISQIRHWGARFSARPLPALEIGLSRISQWGGRGMDNSFGAWKDMLLLDDDANVNADNMAALDLTYHLTLFNRPFSLYTEIADDNGTDKLNKPMYLAGIRTFYGTPDGIHTLNLEWSDTYIRCEDAEHPGLCAYSGSGIYAEGYRRYGRIIGSGYGADARVLSSSYRYQTYEGYSWAVSLLYGKYYQLNTALDSWQLRLEYRQPLFNGLLSIEGRAFDKSPQPDMQIKRGSLAATWEYRF